jgi:signal recognition particle subunit SEC65
METVQIKIINPKAKKLLTDLEDLKLIRISQQDELFPLTDRQKQSIAISRKQVKKGQFKTHDKVIEELRGWLREK